MGKKSYSELPLWKQYVFTLFEEPIFVVCTLLVIPISGMLLELLLLFLNVGEAISCLAGWILAIVLLCILIYANVVYRKQLAGQVIVDEDDACRAESDRLE